MILKDHRVQVELPAGWSGRLFQRTEGAATLHVANFPLPLSDGEFGDRSTAAMRPGSSFAALTEYRPAAGLSPSVGLFAMPRMPLPLDPTSFSRERLAHNRPGQVGMQHFFTVAERPFCVYAVVAGTRETRRVQLAQLSRVLASVRISPR